MALGLLTRVALDPGEESSPAERLEHRISPISSFIAVPVFALLSAGVQFADPGALLGSSLAIGVFFGLVVGKPIGVLGGAWLAARFTHAELNEDLSWRDVIGVALLAGIGFTVSLLVSDLALDEGPADLAKAAVLAGFAGLGGVRSHRPVAPRRCPCRWLTSRSVRPGSAPRSRRKRPLQTRPSQRCRTW